MRPVLPTPPVVLSSQGCPRPPPDPSPPLAAARLLQIHHDAKHPKLAWEPEKCTDMHALTGGVTTQGVAVRGSKKK